MCARQQRKLSENSPLEDVFEPVTHRTSPERPPKYAKVIEVLCNGTPYLQWIWLAKDYTDAFEKLIAAYSHIAECLPRFDRLSDAYRNNPDFQRVLAVIYSDIVEFHRHAYKFFRKSGWKCFFTSTWSGFDNQFKCNLESLSQHTDLVDREANAYLISETMQWRQEALQAAAREAKQRIADQLAAVIAWLGLDNAPHCGRGCQEDVLNRLVDECYAGTTEWVLQHDQIKTWMSGQGLATLWIKGKPGSVKALFAQNWCNFFDPTDRPPFYSASITTTHAKHPSVYILATLLSQILRQTPGLSAYVYTDFVAEGLPSSLSNLKLVLANLLPRTKSPRILIDGIDECIQHDSAGNPSDLNLVKDVLRDILHLASIGNGGLSLKLLLVSRDTPQIIRILSRKPILAIDEESTAVQSAIRSFIHQRISEIRYRFTNIPSIDTVLKDSENIALERSRGMFLWVRLVLSQLEDDAYNLNDLETAIANIPAG
ncbi:hypothetical protein BCR34DRAFT_600139 [Clohesyomyces aquaticus]|uniref:NACHT domain-containing protein n=1 Tax=Clohesyomyces aquaticus TaxID=1231657 RepID=A0A1Y1ZT93_9PLEO|nr:hypothetical protein BCR34DRAFT_600139 [Clohesyomyces aquaticus]